MVKPHRQPLDAAASAWRAELRGAILSRVVPRLAEPPLAEGEPRQTDASAFADAALAGPVSDLFATVDRRRAAGVDPERLLLDLVAPAARRLGELWLADRISFLDVTAGLGRLQALVRALGPALERGSPRPDAGRRILLAPVPGEQHVFGLSIVAAFFRRAGWEVTFEPRIGFDDLLALAAAERFTAIGLSAAGDGFIGAMGERVSALRRASENRGVVVLGGGPAFLLDPDLARRSGVDAAPRDAAEAVRAAVRLAARATA